MSRFVSICRVGVALALFAVGVAVLEGSAPVASAGAATTRNWLLPSVGATVPTGVYGPLMAFDSAHGETVVFGGRSDALANDFLSDTWTFNGASWTHRTPLHSPSGRAWGSMTYDATIGKVVLFGGGTLSATAETWTWDGADWTHLTPATSPPARRFFAMGDDAAHGKIVLFGGLDAVNNALGDTWTFDGTTWTQKAPATSPPARFGMAMATASSGGTIMFGGNTSVSGSQALGDTWKWDGTTWTAQSPAHSPSARTQPSMAYDSANGDVVLFGGSDTVFHNDTWIWSGTDWTSVTTTTSPAARWGAGLAYDSVRHEVVLFGGSNGGAFSDTSLLASAPGAPTKVVATSSLDRRSVVSWTAPASNGGSPISGYTVTAAPGGATCRTAARKCTVLGLKNGVSYRFTVRATNAVGVGPTSAKSNLVVPRTVPGAPTITKVVNGVGTITLTWSLPATTGGALISGYNVYAGRVSGKQSTKPLNAAPLHTRSFTWRATKGVLYYFTVKAINSRGVGAASKQAIGRAR